jgi:hypothetical protein
MSKQKLTHFMGDSPSFFKRRLKILSFLFSDLEDARNTWCLCKIKLQKRSGKSKSEIPSFIHLTQSAILIAHKIQGKPEQQQQSAIKFGSRKRDSSHGDGFKSCLLELHPFFSPKDPLFFRNHLDNPPSNFTGNTIQCISID